MNANPLFTPIPGIEAWMGATQSFSRSWADGWAALLQQQASMMAAFNRQVLNAWTGSLAFVPGAAPKPAVAPQPAADTAPLPEVTLAPLVEPLPLPAAPAEAPAVPQADEPAATAPVLAAPALAPEAPAMKPAKRPRPAAPLRAAAPRKAAGAQPKGRRATRH